MDIVVYIYITWLHVHTNTGNISISKTGCKQACLNLPFYEQPCNNAGNQQIPDNNYRKCKLVMPHKRKSVKKGMKRRRRAPSQLVPQHLHGLLCLNPRGWPCEVCHPPVNIAQPWRTPACFEPVRLRSSELWSGRPSGFIFLCVSRFSPVFDFQF